MQWCPKCLSVRCLRTRRALDSEAQALFPRLDAKYQNRLREHQDMCNYTARRKVRTMLITGTSPSVTI